MSFIFIVELNGTHIETLEEPPSPTEFMRLVHISRPVVIKGNFDFFFRINMDNDGGMTGVHQLALDKWSDEYLRSKMADREISVATTPNGFVIMQIRLLRNK